MDKTRRQVALSQQQALKDLDDEAKEKLGQDLLNRLRLSDQELAELYDIAHYYMGLAQEEAATIDYVLDIDEQLSEIESCQ